METRQGESKGAAGSDRVVYCVVPPRLAAIRPRLCEHFAAGGADVEVVVDERVTERRSDELVEAEELAARLVPGLERRTPGGRRAAVPIDRPVVLPPELRRYEEDLTFLAVPDWNAVAAAAGAGEEDWESRCISAEQQALELARALIDVTDSLRSRGGFSPRRFLDLTRAERAIDGYYRWCSGRERPDD